MQDNVNKTGENKRPELGKYSARCHYIFDLGVHQANIKYDPSNRILFGFELVTTNEKFSKEENAPLQPFTMSKEFNRYVSKTSHLGEFIGKWMPNMMKEGGKVIYKDLCGKPGILHVEENEGTGKHEGKTFSNINKVVHVSEAEGKLIPKLRSALVFFELGADCFIREAGEKKVITLPWYEMYNKLMSLGKTYKWILSKVASSQNFNELVHKEEMSTIRDSEGNVEIVDITSQGKNAPIEEEEDEFQGDEF